MLKKMIDLHVSFVLLSFIALQIISCSSKPVTSILDESDQDNTKLLLQDQLILGKTLNDVELPNIEILALNDEIKKLLDINLRPIKDPYKKHQALKKILFSKHGIGIGIQFQALETKSAIETYNSRTANCLSFANLYIAMARYLGLHAKYQLVHAPPTWVKENDSWILNHHINVISKLKNKMQYEAIDSHPFGSNLSYLHNAQLNNNFIFNRHQTRDYIVDVSPDADTEIYDRVTLKDSIAHSYFYSNVGTEYLLKDDLQSAYRYIKKAIIMNHRSADAWNTLGLIYKRSNHFDLAEKAYLTAISTNDESYSALSNLARLYKQLGKTALANSIEDEIHVWRIKNPYYHYMLGQNAYNNEDYKNAIKHLTTATKLKRDDHEFYFALAKSYAKIGSIRRAKLHLKKADTYAQIPDNKYENKLKLLNKTATGIDRP